MFHEYFKKIRNSFWGMVTSRLFPIQAIVIVFGAILIYRMFYLQIMNGDVYYDKYMNQTKQIVSVPATRGKIFDRNGKVLAYDEITYSVTIKDLEVYTGKGQLNSMIYRLVQILDKYDAEINTEIPVIINSAGKYEFSGREAKIHQFIKDVYSDEKIKQLEKKGEDPYSYDAETVLAYMAKNIYGFKNMTGKNGLANYEELSREDALKIMNIRYAMTANSYRKYLSTVVSENVSPEVQAAILENQQEIQGVEIEEDTIRKYTYPEEFCHILGYTGKASNEELAELQLEDETYELGDVVGKTGSGIEYVMEQELSGTKGNYTIYKDSRGVILEVLDEVEPVAGNDVYLSIDADLQIAVYNMIEEQLAGAIYNQIILEDFTPTTSTLTFYICIRDIYYQMINNNILSYEHFEAADASETEQAIYNKYNSYYSGIREAILMELTSYPTPMEQLSEEMKEYLKYVDTMLREHGVIVADNIDKKSAVYTGWIEGTVTLKEYLTACVENQWIDIETLECEEKYSNSEEIQEHLIDYIDEKLGLDSGFVKMLYDYLIHEKIVTGNEICLALFDQGILVYDEKAVELLKTNQNETVPMEFMKEKIYNLEITPAMIALDPCSGGAVVTDPKTGEILALVSYPGYDLNQLSGTIDAEYYSKLSKDLSSPMYNRATQTRLSPGSTYKMLSGIAGVMENVIDIDETIVCNGIFEFTNQMCWIMRESGGMHGPMEGLRKGLANSCNDYFFEIGYRLSLNKEGEYIEEQGIELLAKYASIFGFDSKTGIEIRENVSQISDEYPVASAIGQGTNNFTVIQLNRYVTAIASRGDLYEYTLLDRVTDYQGNILEEYAPEVISEIQLPDELWDAIWEGMQMVLTEGSAAGVFNDLDIHVAGKTGTAQENPLRGNNANFIGFAPVEDPQLAVEVMLPHSNKSSHSISISKMIYQYYFDLENLENLVDGQANAIASSVEIHD